MEEHLAQLAAALAGADEGAAERRRFVEGFASPLGAESSPIAAVADEIERLASLPPGGLAKRSG